MEVSYPATEVDRTWQLIGWLACVTIIFQRIEPWAYEAVWAVGFGLAAWRGLDVPRTLLPMAGLAAANAVGFWLSAAIVASDDWHSFLWAGVSTYLAATAFLIAIYVAEDPGPRLGILMRATLVAGVIAAAIAIVGRTSSGTLYYFLMNGQVSAFFEQKNVYTNLRAVAFFKDPNVYAAFMVVPVLIALDRVSSAKGLRLATNSCLLAFLGIGLLLATSRGAFVNLMVSIIVYAVLVALFAPGRATKLHMAMGLAWGCLVLFGSMAILVAASEGVRDDVFGRAVAAMPYDQGPFGRWAGIRMAVEELVRPFGLGPLQFWKAYVARSGPENMAEYFRLFDIGPRNPNVEAFWLAHPDRSAAANIMEFWQLHASNPHNTYLDQFMSGGWISGTTYLALLATTMVGAWRALRRRLPWWRGHSVLLAALIGVCCEGLVIDSEHWRHFFLLLGALWGSGCGISRIRLSFFKDSSKFQQQVSISSARLT